MRNVQLIALGICFGIILVISVQELTTDKNIEYEKSSPYLTDEEKLQYIKDNYPQIRDPYIQPNVETQSKGYYRDYNRTKRRDRELDRYIEHYIEENRDEILEKYLD